MAKKIFVTKTRIVRGDRWYLDYTRFDFEAQKETRHRKDFDLNEIADLELREQVAIRLARYLDDFIQTAAPPRTVIVPEEPAETVEFCVNAALQVKLNLPRKNSHKSYRSFSGIFLEWARDRSYAKIPINTFTKKHCRAFFEWLTKRKQYRAVTLNNYLIHLRALWYEMVNDELTKENPWTVIKPRQKQEKLRRVFSKTERQIVAKEIEKTDYWMFRGVLLQYFGYIRPVELARLKFKDFDLKKGVVEIQAWVAKKWKKRYATIPESVMHYFKDGIFDKQPSHYYIFGTVNHAIMPSANPGGDNRMYQRHRQVLERLVAEKRLVDMKGLSWYSWKDTGISMHAARTSPISTRDQAGHGDIKITMLYYHADEVIPEYKNLPNDLF